VTQVMAGLLARGSPPSAQPSRGSPQWLLFELGLAAHSCGGSRGFAPKGLTAFPIIPSRGPSPLSRTLRARVGACQSHRRSTARGVRQEARGAVHPWPCPPTRARPRRRSPCGEKPHRENAKIGSDPPVSPPGPALKAAGHLLIYGR
jgi:hypothetical protein